MHASNFKTSDYYEKLKEKKILGSQCKACGAVHFPGRAICSSCFSEAMDEVEFSGAGTLAAYSVIYVPPSAMVEAGYGRENPNCAGIVKLVEGPMVSAEIIGVDVSQPQAIKIGTPLQAKFIERGEKVFLAFEA